MKLPDTHECECGYTERAASWIGCDVWWCPECGKVLKPMDKDTKDTSTKVKCEACPAVRALKVIRTWASVPGALVPEHVVSLCDEAIKEVEDEIQN